MDKITLLRERRGKVLAAGNAIRKAIASLVDADSFVEQAGFSFSKNEFYQEEEAGEGVVTGFATIDGNPVYIAAQNFEILDGGISKEGCAKILKCLELAEKNSTPIVYILNSLGVQVGEGVSVLEGLAGLLAKAAKLHGVVPQFAVVNGEVYGQSALLAACADFTFFMKNGVLSADSPLVISARSGKNLAKALETKFNKNKAEYNNETKSYKMIVMDKDAQLVFISFFEKKNISNVLKQLQSDPFFKPTVISEMPKENIQVLYTHPLDSDYFEQVMCYTPNGSKELYIENKETLSILREEKEGTYLYLSYIDSEAYFAEGY